MDTIPDLNAITLHNLARNINENFSKASVEAKTALSSRKSSRKKKDNVEDVTFGGPNSSQKDVSVNGRMQGKKRLRNGNVKRREEQENSSGKQAERNNLNGRQPTTKKDVKVANLEQRNEVQVQESAVVDKGIGQEAEKPKKAKHTMRIDGHTRRGPKLNGIQSSKLEDEVTLLGGTADDVALLKDADSESELEGSRNGTTDVKLGLDLKKLAHQLGIQKLVPSDASNLGSKTEKNGPENSKQESKPDAIAIIPHDVWQSPKAVQPKSGTRKIASLMFDPLSEWHSALLPQLPVSSQANQAVSRGTLENLQAHARFLLEEENQHYAAKNGSSTSAHRFYSTIMTSGTLSDKISALTLSVQESPVHNMRALETLLGLARKRSRGQAVDVLGALKDLLGQGSLLPSDRKLRVFGSQPGLSVFSNHELAAWHPAEPLPRPLKHVHLISWAYEDWLKALYFEVLKILETWCNDEVVFARSKAVDYVYELLRDKPEQETNLLRLLVNKLGDSDKKVASKTSYNILQLENSHPMMKPLIVAAIESDLIFRPGQSLHAKYYAVITLNQTVLSGREASVARKLLDIYFGIFLGLLTNKPESAEPVVSEPNTVNLNRKGERQGGGGQVGKKARQKSTLQAKHNTVAGDLREKMLSAVLTGVNRAIPFTNTEDEAFERHLDTLFRITHSSNFNTSIQALMLIQQICESHQSSADRFYRTLYESLLDPRLLNSSKQAMYLNLLFRALRSDLKVKRVKAFSKRLLQVVAMHQASFACGALYLVRELEGVFPSLAISLDNPEEVESDEEEAFRDVEDGALQTGLLRTASTTTAKSARFSSYDGRKREPEFSNADQSCLWEISTLISHYHPSVELFASRLLSHGDLPAKPDLSMHTLIHFLDRFVYRNPKKTAGAPRGTSIMQPLASNDLSGLLVSARSENEAKSSVNTETFKRLDGGKVGVDEVFFHKYFSTIGRGKEQGRKKNMVKEANRDRERGDAEDEDEIWKALVDSRPELEGDESDDDLEMEDLESHVDTEEAVALEVVGASEDNEETSDHMGVSDLEGGEDSIFGSEDEVRSNLHEVFGEEVRFAGEQNTDQLSNARRSKRRQRLKNLPTFASAEDYATMLGDQDEVE